jgi:type II secretory pathway predicted ATPase ExeA
VGVRRLVGHAPLFPDGTVGLIHLTSHGLPCSVNNVALQVL